MRNQAVIRLFDLLYRNYPIGAFLLWETKESVPFREFMQEFDPEQDRAESAEQNEVMIAARTGAAF